MDNSEKRKDFNVYVAAVNIIPGLQIIEVDVVIDPTESLDSPMRINGIQVDFTENEEVTVKTISFGSYKDTAIIFRCIKKFFKENPLYLKLFDAKE